MIPCLIETNWIFEMLKHTNLCWIGISPQVLVSMFRKEPQKHISKGKIKKKIVNKQTKPSPNKNKQKTCKGHNDHISKDWQAIPLNSHKYNTVAFHIYVHSLWQKQGTLTCISLEWMQIKLSWFASHLLQAELAQRQFLWYLIAWPYAVNVVWLNVYI